MSEISKLDAMIEALIQYYEAAGFKDIYEKDLKNKSYEAIEKMYIDLIGRP